MKPTIPFLGISLLFLLSSPLHAGLFDDLKRQAEKAVRDTAKDIAGSVVPGGQQQEERQQDEPVATPASNPGGTSVHQPSTPAGQGRRQASLSESEMRGLQICLGRLGYYQGKPDGKYGPGTAAAIRYFQQASGMPADGRATRGILDDCGRVYRTPAQRASFQQDAAQRVPKKVATTRNKTSSKPRYTEYPVLGGKEDQFRYELFAVRFKPELYSSKRYNIQRAIQKLYSEEWRSAKDEFERRRKSKELEKRLYEDAAKVPLIYRFVVPADLGTYDFKNQRYQIWVRKQLPVVPDISISHFFLNMPPDEAERFKKDCVGNRGVCKLYMEWVVEVVGSLGPGGALPVADVKQLRVYRTSNNDAAPDALLSDLVLNVNLDEMPVDNYYVKNMGRKPARAKKKQEKNTMEIEF